jgi:hypothetical protein
LRLCQASAIAGSGKIGNPTRAAIGVQQSLGRLEVLSLSKEIPLFAVIALAANFICSAEIRRDVVDTPR